MTDYISREALLAKCKEAQKSDPNADGRGWANHFLNAAGEPSTEWYCVEDMIENAPTIDAVPVVRGKWTLLGRRGIYGVMYECSACHAKYDGITNFCPYCGAKMDGGEKDEVD